MNIKVFLIPVIALYIFTLSSIVQSQSRFEISFHTGYSGPRYESYGTDVYIANDLYTVTIGGKRLLVSDNLGMNYGFSFQLYGKYSFFRAGYLKAVFNVGFNQLEGKYSTPFGSDRYGVRMPVFSLGTGIELNPIGMHKFYPSLIGLIRWNEIGGESFYHAGLDFFIVQPRFGYVYGFNLNYKLSQFIGLSAGTTFNYDNWLNKKTNDGTIDDPHAINFRDKASSTNGLTQDRRIAYLSLLLGINFYLK
ncbi:MAG: hypothetical protein ABSF32_02255 [Ignavibacteria bacterium]|jgi:hypothetical protein